MKRTLPLPSLIVFMLSLVGIQPVGAQATKGDPVSEDRKQIQELLSRYEAALNASDTNAVLELYAKDGIFMPSSAPTAAGTIAVRGAYDHVFSTIRLAIKFHVDEIVVDGSMAFARTGSRGTVTVLAKGVTAPEENRELFVLQKRDGHWKIARYIFNKLS